MIRLYRITKHRGAEERGLHLLLVHQVFGSPHEAGGTRHYELARHLRAAGHRVTVLTSNVSYMSGEVVAQPRGLVSKEITPEGIEVWRCYTYKALHRTILRRLVAYVSFTISAFLAGLQVKGVDVVCGTYPQPIQGIASWALARIRRVPFVFEVRDLWPDTIIELGHLKQPFIIALWRFIERFLYRAADLVVPNSPGFLPHLHRCGVPDSRIAVVTNGVETANFDPASRGEAFRREHGLEGRCIVMYAGTHGLTMDLDVLLDVADLLRNEPEIIFVLVGHGINKANLVRRAESMKLTNVLFVPPQPKDRMPEILAAADVLVATLRPVPTLTKVYPNKVFDYMAAGRPTILSIDGVIRQVIEEANGGVYVPARKPAELADAILRLYRDEDLRRRMGASARAYVEAHFDRSIQARAFENVLRRVTASSLPPDTVKPPVAQISPRVTSMIETVGPVPGYCQGVAPPDHLTAGERHSARA